MKCTRKLEKTFCWYYSLGFTLCGESVSWKKATQCAGGESNKIVYNKKETVTAWKYDTYRVRNHFVSNPTNSKFKRLEIKKI